MRRIRRRGIDKQQALSWVSFTGQYKQEEIGVPTKKSVGPTNSEELLNGRIQAVQQPACFGFTRLIDCNSFAVHHKSLPGQFL